MSDIPDTMRAQSIAIVGGTGFVDRTDKGKAVHLG